MILDRGGEQKKTYSLIHSHLLGIISPQLWLFTIIHRLINGTKSLGVRIDLVISQVLVHVEEWVTVIRRLGKLVLFLLCWIQLQKVGHKILILRIFGNGLSGI